MEFLKNQETAEKIEKFTSKKLGSLKINKILADYYRTKEFKPRKADNILNCSSYLLFRNYLDSNRTRKLVAANFCKHPLCLMCAWRLHLKRVFELQQGIELLKRQEPDMKFYFLNLTVKNWSTIDKAKLRDLQAKAVKFIRKSLGVKDYYCSLEITISKANRELPYHPHIHSILGTTEALGTTLQDINKLRQIWRKVYGETEHDFLEMTLYPIRENSINEVTKYILKPEQKISEKEVIDIAIAITGLKKTFSAGKLRRGIQDASEDIKTQNGLFLTKIELYGFFDEFYRWVDNKYLIKTLDE